MQENRYQIEQRMGFLVAHDKASQVTSPSSKSTSISVILFLWNLASKDKFTIQLDRQGPLAKISQLPKLWMHTSNPELNRRLNTNFTMQVC